MQNKESFNWLDAIFSIALFLAGFTIIVTAKSNLFIALGVVFIVCAAIQSEENRKIKRDS